MQLGNVAYQAELHAGKASNNQLFWEGVQESFVSHDEFHDILNIADDEVLSDLRKWKFERKGRGAQKYGKTQAKEDARREKKEERKAHNHLFKEWEFIQLNIQQLSNALATKTNKLLNMISSLIFLL